MRRLTVPPARRALVLGACLLLSACDGVGIRADAGYAQFSLGGDIGLSSTTTPGLRPVQADVENELGLGDQMGSPYGRIEAGLGIASVTVSAFDIDQSGSGVVSAAFGDIPVNTRVSTDIDILNVKAAVHFDLLNVGFLRISPGVGVDVFDLDLSARASQPVVLEESVDAVAPVPMLFLQGEVDAGIFDIVADVGGIYVDVGDASGAFIDIEILARVEPVDHVELFAGFRHIMIDVEGRVGGQEFLGDLTLTGWMVGGGIRF